MANNLMTKHVFALDMLKNLVRVFWTQAKGFALNFDDGITYREA